MKFECNKCLKLKEEKDIIRMVTNEYWCEDCYDKLMEEEKEKENKKNPDLNHKSKN